VHDIIYNEDELIFCDSFGEYYEDDSKLNTSGNIIFNGEAIEKEFFSSFKNDYLIRGVASSENEILVGCSSIAQKRSERNKSKGGLILL